MAAPRVPDKWRPSLALIVFAVLLTVLALPAAVVIWIRSLDNSANQMGPIELGALGVSLLITVAIGVVFSRTITGPIHALVKRAEAIGRGGRAAIRSPDQLGTLEIAELSQSFLDLAERLVDRTEHVSSFAAHVSHELKSPVTAIRGSAELLRDAKMSDDERRKFLDHIIADSDRLTGLLERLRELARADIGMEPGTSRLAALRDASGFGDVALSGSVDTSIGLSEEALRAVFGQLVSNSREHGATAIRVDAVERDSRLVITVADNGSGISPGNRDRVFEPFFTTRRETGGTGMGLQIVRSMLAAHGASVRLLDVPSGAVFEISVPLA